MICNHYIIVKVNEFYSLTNDIDAVILNFRKELNQAATYDVDVKGQHARTLYPALVDKLSSLNYEKILDLGCGTGAVLKPITDKNKHAQAYGLDISENMLKQAEQKLNDRAMLSLDDAEHLPFENDSIPRSIMNAFIRFSNEGDVRIYSKKEICGLLSLYFHDIEWQKTVKNAFIASAIK